MAEISEENFKALNKIADLELDRVEAREHCCALNDACKDIDKEILLISTKIKSLQGNGQLGFGSNGEIISLNERLSSLNHRRRSLQGIHREVLDRVYEIGKAIKVEKVKMRLNGK